MQQNHFHQELIKLLNDRKKRILVIAQVAMSEHQFKAYRSLILDELGKEGLESDLMQYLNAGKHLDHKRNGQE